MQILIRTDIGGEHGMGHASRCLTLAKVLRERGAEVLFTTTTPKLESYVQPFPYHLQGTMIFPEPFWNATHIIDTKADDWPTENKFLALLKRKYGKSIVRIDHPHATPESCDLLIGPCAHWESRVVSKLQREFGARFLYGWPYVILDPSITEQSVIPYAERKNGPIVFCAGGSDPSGALQKMYDMTQTWETSHACVFLYGQYSQEPSMGKTSRPHVTTCRVFDRRWLRVASLVVTMFGQTVYECLYYNTPVLALGHTDENVEAACRLQLQAPRNVLHGGDVRKFTKDIFIDSMHCALSWFDNRNALNKLDIDDKGASRIADAILALASS